MWEHGTATLDAWDGSWRQWWDDALVKSRKGHLVNLRLSTLGSYEVRHGTTHAYPDSTDELVDGCTVFRNGRLWFWSSARHMWMTKRVAA